LGGEPQLIDKGPGGYYTPAGWSPDDAALLVQRVKSNINQDLYVIDLGKEAVRRLTRPKGDVQYHSPVWSADGKYIYCASTAQGPRLPGRASIDVGTGILRNLETPEHEVEHVAASPKGRWLAWLVNNDGRSELTLRDLKTKQTLSPPGLPLGVISHLEFAPDD